MKSKHILLLAVALGVLIGAIVWKQSQRPAELSTEEFSPLNLKLDAAQVEKIVVSSGPEEKAVELVKGEQGWKVENFFQARADEDKISGFLKEIKALKGELRGKNKTLFPDFQIADEEAYRIIFSRTDGTELLSLLVGLKVPNYRSVFLRQKDSEQVYITGTNLFEKMGVYSDPVKEKPKPDYWASMSLVGSRAGAVERIEIKKVIDGKDTLVSSVIRETDSADSTKKKWKYTRPDLPFQADNAKVEQFVIGTLSNWKASKALDPNAKDQDYGLDKPAWQMQIGFDGGSELALVIGKKDPSTNAYFIKPSDDPVVFQLPDYYFRSVDIDDSKFFPDNPLNAKPETIEKLMVHTPEADFHLNPKDKKWDSLTTYLNDLKPFTVPRLLFDPAEVKKVKAPGHYWLEIIDGSDSTLLDVGEKLPGDKNEYAAQRRGSAQTFALTEATFNQLFANLDRLKEPQQS